MIADLDMNQIYTFFHTRNNYALQILSTTHASTHAHTHTHMLLILAKTFNELAKTINDESELGNHFVLFTHVAYICRINLPLHFIVQLAITQHILSVVAVHHFGIRCR